jgi:hypothetical protein
MRERDVIKYFRFIFVTSQSPSTFEALLGEEGSRVEGLGRGLKSKKFSIKTFGKSKKADTFALPKRKREPEIGRIGGSG